MKPHRWINVLVGMVIVISFTLWSPKAALAASCSGYGCDGKDPYATGCAGAGASYRVIDMRYVYNEYRSIVGYVQLWWSDTCKTNWARAVRTVSYGTTYYTHAHIFRDNNWNRVIDNTDTRYDTWVRGATAVYTRMVYAPVLLAQACGGLDTDAVYDYQSCTDWR